MVTRSNKYGLTLWQAILKRSFDFIFSMIGLFFTWWIILFSYILASIDTKSKGFFTQLRVGRNGKLFKVIKIRTMRNDSAVNTTVTTAHDPRITSMGYFFRKTKIDELPQLINVLKGEMSFVGPRPDVPGFADLLKGDDRLILAVRPGITGPASLKYRHEEFLLKNEADPEAYNAEVIFPDKVRINKEYVQHYRFMDDIKYIIQTFIF